MIAIVEHYYHHPNQTSSLPSVLLFVEPIIALTIWCHAEVIWRWWLVEMVFRRTKKPGPPQDGIGRVVNTGTPVRIACFGAGAAGKTAIITRLATGRYVELYDPTIEDTYTMLIQPPPGDITSKPRILNLLDTPGQEEFESLLTQHMRSQDGYILVYNPNEPKSLEYLLAFLHRIMRVLDIDNYDALHARYPVVVVANYSDQWPTPLDPGERFDQFDYKQLPSAAAETEIKTVLTHSMDLTASSTSGQHLLAPAANGGDPIIAPQLLTFLHHQFDEATHCTLLPPLVTLCLSYLRLSPFFKTPPVSWSDAQEFANVTGCQLMRASALLNRGIHQPFWYITCRVEGTPYQLPPPMFKPTRSSPPKWLAPSGSSASPSSSSPSSSDGKKCVIQ